MTMVGENGVPETPDWSPTCHCGETPCVNTPTLRWAGDDN